MLWLGSGKFSGTNSFTGQTNQSSPWLVILEMSYHPTFTGTKRGRVGKVGEYPKNQIVVPEGGSKQLMMGAYYLKPASAIGTPWAYS